STGPASTGAVSTGAASSSDGMPAANSCRVAASTSPSSPAPTVHAWTCAPASGSGPPASPAPTDGPAASSTTDGPNTAVAASSAAIYTAPCGPVVRRGGTGIPEQRAISSATVTVPGAVPGALERGRGEQAGGCTVAFFPEGGGVRAGPGGARCLPTCARRRPARRCSPARRGSPEQPRGPPGCRPPFRTNHPPTGASERTTGRRPRPGRREQAPEGGPEGGGAAGTRPGVTVGDGSHLNGAVHEDDPVGACTAIACSHTSS